MGAAVYGVYAAEAISEWRVTAFAAKNASAKRCASAIALALRDTQLSPEKVLIRTAKAQDIPGRLEWLHRTEQCAVSASMS
jgi:hypothetical protein